MSPAREAEADMSPEHDQCADVVSADIILESPALVQAERALHKNLARQVHPTRVNRNELIVNLHCVSARGGATPDVSGSGRSFAHASGWGDHLFHDGREGNAPPRSAAGPDLPGLVSPSCVDVTPRTDSPGARARTASGRPASMAAADGTRTASGRSVAADGGRTASGRPAADGARTASGRPATPSDAAAAHQQQRTASGRPATPPHGHGPSYGRASGPDGVALALHHHHRLSEATNAEQPSVRRGHTHDCAASDVGCGVSSHSNACSGFVRVSHLGQVGLVHHGAAGGASSRGSANPDTVRRSSLQNGFASGSHGAQGPSPHVRVSNDWGRVSNPWTKISHKWTRHSFTELVSSEKTYTIQAQMAAGGPKPKEVCPTPSLWEACFGCVPQWGKDYDIVMPEQKLKERLTRLKLDMIVMESDGNCQFRTLSFQLFGTPDNHVAVRKRVIDHIKDNEAEYSCFLREDFSVYVEMMSRPGVWGDELTLRAACDSYGTVVRCITSDDINWYLTYEPQKLHSKRELFLAYIAPMHYNALRRSDPAHPGLVVTAAEVVAELQAGGRLAAAAVSTVVEEAEASASAVATAAAGAATTAGTASTVVGAVTPHSSGGGASSNAATPVQKEGGAEVEEVAPAQGDGHDAAEKGAVVVSLAAKGAAAAAEGAAPRPGMAAAAAAPGADSGAK